MAKKPSKFIQSKKPMDAEQRKKFIELADRFAPSYADERRFMVIQRPDGTIIEPPESVKPIPRRN